MHCCSGKPTVVLIINLTKSHFHPQGKIGIRQFFDLSPLLPGKRKKSLKHQLFLLLLLLNGTNSNFTKKGKHKIQQITLKNQNISIYMRQSNISLSYNNILTHLQCFYLFSDTVVRWHLNKAM